MKKNTKKRFSHFFLSILYDNGMSQSASDEEGDSGRDERSPERDIEDDEQRQETELSERMQTRRNRLGSTHDIESDADEQSVSEGDDEREDARNNRKAFQRKRRPSEQHPRNYGGQTSKRRRTGKGKNRNQMQHRRLCRRGILRHYGERPGMDLILVHGSGLPDNRIAKQLRKKYGTFGGRRFNYYRLSDERQLITWITLFEAISASIRDSKVSKDELRQTNLSPELELGNITPLCNLGTYME